MHPITWDEFRKLVSEAVGPFSYRFVAIPKPMFCDPAIYKAIQRNQPSH